MFNELVAISSPVFSISITYLLPIVAIGWGLIDGETFTLVQWGGCVLILFGVYLITEKKHLKKKKILIDIFILLKKNEKFNHLFYNTFDYKLLFAKKYNKILTSLDADLKKYEKIAQDIWSFAEMGYQEENSSNLLQKTLKDEGFKISKV